MGKNKIVYFTKFRITCVLSDTLNSDTIEQLNGFNISTSFYFSRDIPKYTHLLDVIIIVLIFDVLNLVLLSNSFIIL